MSVFKKLAKFIADEPVVVIAGALQSGLVWLFTYVITDWSPAEHSLDLAGLATGAAFLISMVARQFVTPAAKVIRQVQPAVAKVLADADKTEPGA